MAIIAILVALMVPAIQKMRDAALRVSCMNNLKQLGVACHGYHNANRSLPAGMRYQRGKDPNLFSTWLAQVLPYVEQDNLWKRSQVAYTQSSNPFKNPPHVGLSTAIPTFTCPADPYADQVLFAERTGIPVAFTSYLGVEGRDVFAKDGLLFRDSRVRFTEIVDGTSQTLLAGERPPSQDLQFGWWYAGTGQNFTGSCDSVLGVEEQNILLVTAGSCAPGTYIYGPGNLSNQCDMFHFWSLHSGGAQFVFADGSVHFLSYSAAPILPALASRAGGETTVFND
jgi:prepilin-type processing-associated H-X9-DG protein